MNGLTLAYSSFIGLLALMIYFDLNAAATVSNSLVWFVNLMPKMGIPFHDGFLSGPWPTEIYRVLVGYSAWFSIVMSIALGISTANKFDFFRHPTNMALRQIEFYNCGPYSGKIIQVRIAWFALWIFAAAVSWLGFSGSLTFL
jgi:hypothetical protein